jgi:hypothetical protein
MTSPKMFRAECPTARWGIKEPDPISVQVNAHQPQRTAEYAATKDMSIRTDMK